MPAAHSAARTTVHRQLRCARLARRRGGWLGAAVWRTVLRGALSAERGQALLETALVMPVVLLLVSGIVGVYRVTGAQGAISATAAEAARAGALANTPSDALAHAVARGQDVARGYGLTNGSLELSVDATRFGRNGQVRTAARYQVELVDLPLFGWTRVSVSATGLEWVDPYRSGIVGGVR